VKERLVEGTKETCLGELWGSFKEKEANWIRVELSTWELWKKKAKEWGNLHTYDRSLQKIGPRKHKERGVKEEIRGYSSLKKKMHIKRV